MSETLRESDIWIPLFSWVGTLPVNKRFYHIIRPFTVSTHTWILLRKRCQTPVKLCQTKKLKVQSTTYLPTEANIPSYQKWKSYLQRKR
jgi:hypothetical protein